jgi:hypothetical protein
MTNARCCSVILIPSAPGAQPPAKSGGPRGSPLQAGNLWWQRWRTRSAYNNLVSIFLAILMSVGPKSWGTNKSLVPGPQSLSANGKLENLSTTMSLFKGRSSRSVLTCLMYFEDNIIAITSWKNFEHHVFNNYVAAFALVTERHLWQ